MTILLRMAEANGLPISSPIWVISTTFERKLEYIYVTILGLAESFKPMNRPSPIVTMHFSVT